MDERNECIHDLIEQVEKMITKIEDHECNEPDFVSVRELAENFRDELESLQDL